LQAKGLKVSIQKFDPYYSVDAGLLNPGKHGECFVTRDGAETDLDLGHYERFLDIETTNNCIYTSGKIFQKIITAERAGKFGGNEVQLIPHVTGLIQDTFEQTAAEFDSDVHIVEIGGTVGDLEGVHFIEALREFPTRVGRENCFYTHVVYVPYLVTSHEYKTKPAQNSIHDLRTFGIMPNMIVARVDDLVGTNSIANKIATFTGVLEEDVMIFPNAKSVYEVPMNAIRSGIMKPLGKLIGDDKVPNMSKWESLQKKASKKYAQTVSVGLVAKYVSNTDTYISVTEALKAAAFNVGVNLELKWINAEKASAADFESVDGLLVPGGFGSRGIDGKIAAASFALSSGKPYLGLCLGLQVAAIAAARRAGLDGSSGSALANSEEFGARAEGNVIYIMEGQKGKESTGGTMRLGDYEARLVKGSLTADLYGSLDVIERHRHRYEVNQKFLPEIEKGGLKVSGTSPDGKLVEFVERASFDDGLSGNGFFVATQAHPEFRSRPNAAHPLFVGFIRALKK
jgi:CTP synthase